MGRDPIRSALMVAVLVFLMIGNDCDASLLANFRKLAGAGGPKKKELSQQISPSPSPSSDVGFGTEGPQKHYSSLAPDPAAYGLTSESCTSSLKTCPNESQINMTACLLSSSKVNMELFLLIQNAGESSLEVNVTINSTSQVIQIPKHHIKKVNVSGEGSSSAVLNAGNGTCIIHLELPVPDNSFLKQFYSAVYVTPLNGAYLLFLTALIIGGTWTCCMLVKRGRHVDGVPYQELEMGSSDCPPASSNRVEAAEPWDEGWDDDWDEMKTVKSPRARGNGNVSTNGLTSRSSDRDGWKNNWDD